jgi:hypothetical protein
MTKLRRIMVELFVLALLVTSSAVSLGQLSAKAEESGCDGLTCWDVSDCGPCYCNRPSSTCHKWDEGEIH